MFIYTYSIILDVTMKNLLLPICLLCLFTLTTRSAVLLQQGQYHIEGVVNADAERTPLADVIVNIAALHKYTLTNAKGEFTLSGIPPGEYLVEYRKIGFRTETRRIVITNADIRPLLFLTESPLITPSVTVTAAPQPANTMETPAAAAVVEGKELERRRGQSIMQTLEFLPGVTGFSGSPLAVKPVIRGLTAQRVVVAQNGLRIQSQTWDEPQSPEIDVMDVERIEVVRGAASVLYGSDALGGVVNVVRSDVFSTAGKPLEGIFTLNAFSNNPGAAGGLSLFGGSGGLAYRFNATGRFAGDYTYPAGKLNDSITLPAQSAFNSGAQEFNASGSVGMRRDWGTLALDLSHFGQKYFIHPEPGRKEVELNIHTGLMDTLPAAPSQEIFHERAMLSADIPMNNVRLALTAGFQYNSRKEEGVAESEEDEHLKEEKGIPPEAKLDLTTLSFDAKAHFAELGTLGAYFTHQTNQTLGAHAIIPDYTGLDFGGFGFIEHQVGIVRGNLAVRYDHRALDVTANTELKNSDTTYSFDAFSVQAGFVFTITPEFSASLNGNTGWRAPVAAELFINGQDEGAVRYKVGKPTLTPEHSLNIDASLRYVTPDVVAEVSVFRNAIADYIYVTPTGTRINNLDVYSYTQDNAILLGWEFSLQARLAHWLSVDVMADMVRGENDRTKTPLPMIPAARVRGGLTYHNEEFAGIHHFYFSIVPKYTMKQDRFGLFEGETPSYFLLDAGFGGEIAVAGRMIQAHIAVENIANTPYFDNLSRYKGFAFNPGLGAALRASVPFDIISE